MLAQWAARGEAYRRAVRNHDRRKEGRNRRIRDLYFARGMTALEISRLFDLSVSGIYSIVKRTRTDADAPKASSGVRPPDYTALCARARALRDNAGMTETEIMAVLGMPRMLVRTILEEA